MAENKKSVLLYCDIIHTIEKMDDTTAGLFFKHYLRYINDLDPKTDNLLVDITFESVKQNLKRDLKKWERRAETSRNNGALGGRPPKETQPLKEEPKKPNGLINNPTEPRKPVNVTVTDTVNVKDKVKVKDINNKKEIVKNQNDFSQAVYNCYNSLKNFFPEDLQPKNSTEKNNWLETIEKLNRIDNWEFKNIEAIVYKTRADDFWQKNFLSLTKLRKKDKSGIMYINVFFNKFRIDLKNSQKQTPADRITEIYNSLNQ